MGINLNGTRRQILEWAEAHISDWGDNQVAIGLTSAQVIDLGVSIANARQSFTTVQETRDTAKSETQSFYSFADDVHDQASVAIAAIKAFARNTDDPSAVYLLANITGQNPPSPTPAPDQPSDLEATLQNDGTITLSWNGKGPGGTLYQVFRRLTGEAEFTFIANTGSRNKEYNDTVPAATTFVTYQVRGVHGEKFSTFSPQTNVQIGPVQAAAAEAA